MNDEFILEAIEELVDLCHTNSKAHGFYDGEFNFGEKIALIHSELSEVLESDRRKGHVTNDEHCPEFSNTEIEMADACIRIFDLAGYCGFNLGRAILAKMAYNATRPHKHGKQY